MTGSCLENKPFSKEETKGRRSVPTLSGYSSLPEFTNLKGELSHEKLSPAVYNLTHLKDSPYVVVMVGGLIETSTAWKAFQQKLDAAKISWATLSLDGFDGYPENAKNFTAENSYNGTRRRIQSGVSDRSQM